MNAKLESSFNDVTDSDVLEVKLLKKVLTAMDKEILPSLEVVTGVAEGKKFILEDDFDEGIIGRDPGADFSIEEYVISRRHAKIEKRDDGFYVKDIGSKNGTYVNNKLVSEARLQDGDRISLGTIVIIFRNPKEVDFAAINKAKAVRRFVPAAPKLAVEDESAYEEDVGDIPEQPLGYPASEENPADDEEFSQTGSESGEAAAEYYEDDYPAPKMPAGFSAIEIGLMGLGALIFFIAAVMLVRIFTA
jgi:pSer/pThr/pTyr-binding forkhead associated (FHA) protein